jgi:hypothetical protein
MQMIRIRLADPTRAASLCAFLREASTRCERTSDPALLQVEVPGSLSPEHERRETLGYVRTWQALHRGCQAELFEA